MSSNSLKIHSKRFSGISSLADSIIQYVENESSKS